MRRNLLVLNMRQNQGRMGATVETRAGVEEATIFLFLKEGVNAKFLLAASLEGPKKECRKISIIK